MYHSISLKELRPKLSKVIEKIDEALERYIISKRGEPIAILLALDDFESLLETLNESEDRENLRRIRKGMQEVKRGKTVDWKTVKKRHHLL